MRMLKAISKQQELVVNNGQQRFESFEIRVRMPNATSKPQELVVNNGQQRFENRLRSTKTCLQRHDASDLNLWAPNALACALALLSTARCHCLLVAAFAEKMRGPTWWTSGAHGTLSPWAQAQVFAMHVLAKKKGQGTEQDQFRIYIYIYIYVCCASLCCCAAFRNSLPL